MIDALISGRMRGAVSLRTTPKGEPFAVWRMTAPDKNGGGVLCSCIAFSQAAIDAAQRLSDGDSIAVSGEAAIKAWQSSDGTQCHLLDVLVHRVLTTHHRGKWRKAIAPMEIDYERRPL